MLRTNLINLIAPPSIAPLMRARLGACRGGELRPHHFHGQPGWLDYLYLRPRIPANCDAPVTAPEASALEASFAALR